MIYFMYAFLNTIWDFFIYSIVWVICLQIDWKIGPLTIFRSKYKNIKFLKQFIVENLNVRLKPEMLYADI